MKKYIFTKEIIDKNPYKDIELKTNCFEFEKVQSIIVSTSKEKPPDFLGGLIGGFSFLLTIFLLQLITEGSQYYV